MTAGRKKAAWPPRIGARICRDYGHASPNNWSAEVRAIVDDEIVVIREWSPRRGWQYRTLHRWWFEHDDTRIYAGYLPKGHDRRDYFAPGTVGGRPANYPHHPTKKNRTVNVTMTPNVKPA